MPEHIKLFCSTKKTRNSYTTREKTRNIKWVKTSFIKQNIINISKLLNDSIGQYFVNKNVKFKTPKIRSDLSDYSDVYIVVKETIDLLAATANENDKTCCV